MLSNHWGPYKIKTIKHLLKFNINCASLQVAMPFFKTLRDGERVRRSDYLYYTVARSSVPDQVFVDLDLDSMV